MAETLFTVLRKEHKEIKSLLKEAEKDPRKFSEFTEELNGHVHAEERTLYTPMKNEKELRELILEGFEEHHVVDLIVGEMQGGAAGSEEWHAKLGVLRENLEHHIEEEEQQMFPKAEKVVGRAHAFEMAKEYERVHQTLVGSAH